MDQPASAHRTVLRNLRECCESAILDRAFNLHCRALANKRLHLDASLQAFLQAVSQVLFEKIPLSAVMLNGQRTSSNDLA